MPFGGIPGKAEVGLEVDADPTEILSPVAACLQGWSSACLSSSEASCILTLSLSEGISMLKPAIADKVPVGGVASESSLLGLCNTLLALSSIVNPFWPCTHLFWADSIW